MAEKKIHEAMSALTHGVYVLGVHTPAKDNLMTAAWLCQVCAAPAMLAATVSAGHLTAELIREAGMFTVSVLGSGQKETALACGRVSGRTSDKTQLADTEYTADGIPLIAGATAWLTCKVVSTNLAGDHVVFLAEVVDGETKGGEPLIYREKEFF